MIQPTRSIVIGTAGHIDHGKTALIRALTGIDPDRLPEEKRRGITIDLGFAYLDANSSAGGALRISFVDVPGHSLFIHNMLAGAGCIGAVMLVISAQEGVKPQTVEHLAICSLLGVRTGLTVITKTDAVAPSRVAEIEQEVNAFLHGTFLNRCEIIAVSAKTGQGIAELRQKLIRLAEDHNEGDLDHLPRLPIDRAFLMKGFGTVVTGTLLSGTLRSGEPLALEPAGRAVRVRGIETHGQSAELAFSGSRVALNLAGLEISEVSRGQTLVLPKTLAATTMIDVQAELLPGASGLKHGSLVHFHAFTSNTLARVLLYGRSKFEAGAPRLLRIKLQTPILLVPGDPFVLRQVSPPATMGGGRVLDAHPLARLRKPQAVAWLESLSSASPEERLLLRVARRGPQGLPIGRMMEETGLAREAAQRLCQPLLLSRRIYQTQPETLLAATALDAACENIRSVLQQHARGLKRSELKTKVSLGPGVLDFALDGLAGENKLRFDGESIVPIHAVPEDPRLAAIAAIYQKAGLSAPSISEVATVLQVEEREMRELVTSLLREGTLIRMGDDTLLMHRDALFKLRVAISTLRGQTLDIARFKQVSGLSRKYAIPLLEYLDRERVTRKTGSDRLVL